MWVVKLGGSLFRSQNLVRWLQSMEGLGLVLVPGGGPFADQVRMAQRRWHFGDAVAHHMALIAMEQYGRMICALHPGLKPASSRSEMDHLLKKGRVPVWMASAMVLGEPRLERNWDLTSDSLAAWLTALLQAEALLLIKSAVIEPGSAPIDDLVAGGLVDKAFGHYARAAGRPVWIVSDSEGEQHPGVNAFSIRDFIAGGSRPHHSALRVALQ